MGLSLLCFVFFFFRDHRRRPQHRTENRHRLENSELTMIKLEILFRRFTRGQNHVKVTIVLPRQSDRDHQTWPKWGRTPQLSLCFDHINNFIYIYIYIILPMYTLLLHWNDGRVLALLQHPMCVGSFRFFTALGGGGGGGVRNFSFLPLLLTFELCPIRNLSGSVVEWQLCTHTPNWPCFVKVSLLRFTTRYISGIPIWLQLNRVQSWCMCPMHM